MARIQYQTGMPLCFLMAGFKKSFKKENYLTLRWKIPNYSAKMMNLCINSETDVFENPSLTRMNVNSFQDCEYVIPCQACAKHMPSKCQAGQELTKHCP